MAELLLFHHAQGLMPGCVSLADDLRSAGHVVHLPDLYDGVTFTDLAEGVAHAERIGFGTIIERGRQVAAGLPSEIVYAGMSLGVLPAQMLAQTRPGARGAVLLHGCVPLSEFGPWPPDVPLQIHTMDGDDWGDVEVAREVAATVPGAELFEYPGDRHLFTDAGLAAYDEAAATMVKRRVLDLLGTIDRAR